MMEKMIIKGGSLCPGPTISNLCLWFLKNTVHPLTAQNESPVVNTYIVKINLQVFDIFFKGEKNPLKRPKTQPAYIKK
jgi:hypothetical protein